MIYPSEVLRSSEGARSYEYWFTLKECIKELQIWRERRCTNPPPLLSPPSVWMFRWSRALFTFLSLSTLHSCASRTTYSAISLCLWKLNVSLQTTFRSRNCKTCFFFVFDFFATVVPSVTFCLSLSFSVKTGRKNWKKKKYIERETWPHLH